MNHSIPENTSRNTHHVVAQLLMEDKSCKKVLDIPSGAGAFTKRLLQNSIEVHSADIENIMMVENRNFRQADMNKTLPYADNTFCAVVCIDGIEHIERPFDFIRECHRVLRNGGNLIISTPNIHALRSRWRWFLTGHHNKGKVPLDEVNVTPLHHINMLSFTEIRYLLHANGFEIVKSTTNRIKPISYLYFPIVPLAYLATWAVYNNEEKNPDQRKRNKHILKSAFSKSLLFGETMIVKAECVKP